MSLRKFEPECPGCLPVVLDLESGKPLPDDHPVMGPIIAVWNTLDHETRKAWHAVTCLNSRDPVDLARVQPFVMQIQREIGALEPQGQA